MKRVSQHGYDELHCLGLALSRRGSSVEGVEQQCATKRDERKQVEDEEDRGRRLEQTCYAPNRSPALGSGFRAGYTLKFRSLGGDRLRLTKG